MRNFAHMGKRNPLRDLD